MGWATEHIEKLKKGETVIFRPFGNSMTGRVKSGQLCTVKPINDYSKLCESDIVLCKVNGREYLHLIKKIVSGKYQIGNNVGGINGWVSADLIFGVCTKIE